jgi:hypothetical protein
LSSIEEKDKFLARFSIPIELHRQFKEACAILEIDMSNTISELIQSFLANPQSVSLDIGTSAGAKSSFNFLLDTDLHRSFKAYCSRNGKSMSVVITKLMMIFLERQSRPGS